MQQNNCFLPGTGLAHYIPSLSQLTPLLPPLLQAKALECAQQLGLANFKASGVWLKGWKLRNGVVYQNGSNEVVLPRFSVLASPQSSADPKGSRLLSYTKSCDHIRMPKKAKAKKNSQCSCQLDGSPPVLPSPLPGPVHMDYTALEHSYSQPPGLAEVSAGSAAMDPTVESAVDPSGTVRDHIDFVLPTTHFGPSHLGSTQLSPTQLSPTQPSPAYLGSFPEPSLLDSDPDLDRSDSTLFDPLGMVGEVSELELPLGHEEVVGEEVWLNGKSPSKKSRRGRGKGRGKGGIKRSPTPVATFCYLDDPQGLGGLLASRLSQPVFQTGPEIVYIETTSAFPTHPPSSFET